MELRLGKHNKLRLTQNEYKEVQNEGRIEECFVINDIIKIEVLLSLKVENATSTIEHDKSSNRFEVFLSMKDYRKLILKENEKAGVLVHGISIQVDLWQESKRNKSLS